MSQHTAVTLSVLDMLLYRENIRIIHQPPRLVAYLSQSVFLPHLLGCCVGRLSIYSIKLNYVFEHFFLVCFFMHLCSGSNVFGFRDYIKQRLWLGSVCQRNFVLLSDDAEIPLRAYFQNPALWSGMPPLLIALTTLAYCLIPSQTSLCTSFMCPIASHVGIKQSKIQRTEESLIYTCKFEQTMTVAFIPSVPTAR